MNPCPGVVCKCGQIEIGQTCPLHGRKRSPERAADEDAVMVVMRETNGNPEERERRLLELVEK